jgi:hypothetical protein
LREDQAESLNAAIEKIKKTANTPDDAAALAAICLNYLEGATLQERFVGLEPDAVAAAAMLKSTIAMGTQPSSTYTRRPVGR